MHAPHERPFQFNVRHLFAATLAVCVIAAAGSQLGWAYAVFLALVAISLSLTLYRETRVLGVCGFSLLSAGALLLPVMEASTAPARNTACRSQLAYLGMALRTYHDVWGSFPPAYMTDEAGQPQHSWRTLLLPYLDQVAAYESYKWDEPWNGKNNRAIADIHIEILNCPSDAPAPCMTNYLAVVGPGTAWPGETCTSLADFEDGPENTILLVEVVDTGIRWAEPRDLHLVQMPLHMNPQRGQSLSSRHHRGVNVLFADGNVEYLPESITPAELRAMLTIRGGETTSRR